MGHAPRRQEGSRSSRRVTAPTERNGVSLGDPEEGLSHGVTRGGLHKGGNKAGQDGQEVGGNCRTRSRSVAGGSAETGRDGAAPDASQSGAGPHWEGAKGGRTGGDRRRHRGRNRIGAGREPRPQAQQE